MTPTRSSLEESVIALTGLVMDSRLQQAAALGILAGKKAFPFGAWGAFIVLLRRQVLWTARIVYMWAAAEAHA